MNFEFAALLRLQTGQSFGKKRQTGGENETPITAFGFDYERNDKKLRAKKMGANTLLICSTPFDQFLEEAISGGTDGVSSASIKGF